MQRGFGKLDETDRYIVEDHCRNPRNTEPIVGVNAEASIYNPFCGDEVFVQLKIDQNRVEAICVQGTGCVITQASASMMGELVEGHELSEVGELADIIRSMLQNGDIPDETGTEAIGDAIALRDVHRFPVRIKCALLPWSTLEDTIENYVS